MVHPHRLATGTQIEAPSRRFYFAATSSDSAVAMHAFDLQCDLPSYTLSRLCICWTSKLER